MRKRYIGDYDHAVLASRASGSGNSARSLVYADGILLSNLLGNGATFTPRWGLVTPEEIERVDVLYGPFSAAYPGNSAGAIVDYVTRMPTRLEAHAKVQAYDAAPSTSTAPTSATAAGQAQRLDRQRAGAWSWWVDVHRLDSDGQPMTFATRLVSAGHGAATGTPVTGAVAGAESAPARPWWLLGARHADAHACRTTPSSSWPRRHADAARELHARPLAQRLRALGAELPARRGRAARSTAARSTIDGRGYTLAPTDFMPSTGAWSTGRTASPSKSHTRGSWDWEAAASLYDYREDRVRAPTAALPGALAGGPGRITDMARHRLEHAGAQGHLAAAAARAQAGAHVVEFGVQRDAFRLRTPRRRHRRLARRRARCRGLALRGRDRAAEPVRAGRLALRAALARVLACAPRTLARLRRQRLERASALTSSGARRHVSPKAALAYELAPGVDAQGLARPRGAHADRGRAVPGHVVTQRTVVNNDPNLRPEKSWTGELTAETRAQRGSARCARRCSPSTPATRSTRRPTSPPAPTSPTVQNVDAHPHPRRRARRRRRAGGLRRRSTSTPA